MKDFLGFTRRNLIIYFKDVLAIFFSLLTSIIVFVLYLLFLKGTFVDALEATMNGLENFVSGGDIDMLANGILLTGILGTAMITVPYTCLQTIVKTGNRVWTAISALLRSRDGRSFSHTLRHLQYARS